MKLLRYGRPVGTVFDLLGDWEDDMTYALGFVASRSTVFAQGLAKIVGGTPGKDDGVVRLQEAEEDGRTDLELHWPGAFHCVFEAKRGPQLPTIGQLKKYAPKLSESDAKTKALVAVTNATQAYAERALPAELSGVPVRHLSWRRIRDLVRQVRSEEKSKQRKHLLGEFDAYLTEILGMENVRSNMVYVVSLGGGGTWGLDFKEVVKKRRRYFYPTQGHWPPPPNYIAFRYDGRLQSIHHVDSHDVFANPVDAFPDAKNQKIEPHYLLKLGPAITPPREVRTGDKIRMAMRVWAMIDLLLTCPTITEARDQTKERLGRDAEDIEDDEKD